MSTLKSLLGSAESIAGSAEKAIGTASPDRIAALLPRMREELDADPDSEIWFASSPGRTELAGNHTDHNRGRVLAASINLDTIAAVSVRDDDLVRISSEGFGLVEVALSDLDPREEEVETTAGLVRGVAAGFRRFGHRIGGFDAAVSSTVLPGSGLSSSASFEVLVGVILDSIWNDRTVGSTAIAQIGQYAENTYFGKPSGLMDQMACATGGAVEIDFADPEAPRVNRIHLSFDSASLALLVVDTGASHADLTDEYAAIPRDMRAVAAALGGGVLRDVDPREFYRAIPTLRASLGDRAVSRAIHYFDENRRVELMADALRRNEIGEYIALMADSGRSSGLYLQNCAPVATPEEQGVVIALALTEHHFLARGVRVGVDAACRVHGGGFAGTIQVLMPSDEVDSYRSFMSGHLGDQAVTRLTIRNSGAIAVRS